MHGHIFSLDGANGIVGRLVGVRGAWEAQGGEENRGHCEIQSCAYFFRVALTLESGGKPPHSKKFSSFGASWRQLKGLRGT